MEKREYIGSNKRITIDHNRTNLRIIGNDNKVDIKLNSGSLNVIGNSSRVKIGENTGQINYIGNGGKLYLGTGSNANTVRFTGNNGTIKFMSTDDLWKKHGDSSSNQNKHQ